MPDDAELYVQAEPHWGGDESKFCARLVVEAADLDDARALAALYRLLRYGGSAALRELWRELAHLAAPAAPRPFTL